VTFATKPELARRLLERALVAGARPAWVVADSVYGADHKLRFFLEARQQPYVLAVTSAQSVWVGLTQRRAKGLVALAPADAWQRFQVGAATKGPRLFDWAALSTNHPYDPSWQRSRAGAPLVQRPRGPQLLLRGCLKSPNFVIFHRLCSPFQLPNCWGKRWSAYRES